MLNGLFDKLVYYGGKIAWQVTFFQLIFMGNTIGYYNENAEGFIKGTISVNFEIIQNMFLELLSIAFIDQNNSPNLAYKPQFISNNYKEE